MKYNAWNLGAKNDAPLSLGKRWKVKTKEVNLKNDWFVVFVVALSLTEVLYLASIDGVRRKKTQTNAFGITTSLGGGTGKGKNCLSKFSIIWSDFLEKRLSFQSNQKIKRFLFELFSAKMPFFNFGLRRHFFSCFHWFKLSNVIAAAIAKRLTVGLGIRIHGQFSRKRNCKSRISKNWLKMRSYVIFEGLSKNM